VLSIMVGEERIAELGQTGCPRDADHRCPTGCSGLRFRQPYG
jgi:hypothetical protein